MVTHFILHMHFCTVSALQAVLFAAWRLIWPVTACQAGDIFAGGAFAVALIARRLNRHF